MSFSTLAGTRRGASRSAPGAAKGSGAAGASPGAAGPPPRAPRARHASAAWRHCTTTGVGGQALDYYLLMDAAAPGVEAHDPRGGATPDARLPAGLRALLRRGP